MKKYSLILLVFYCSIFPSLAQDQHLIDSLESILKNLRANKTELKRPSVDLNDSSETLIYVKLALAYNGNNTDLAMDYAEKSLSLSEQIGYKKGVGNGYNIKAIITSSKGDYLSSLNLHKEALKIRKEIGDKRGTAGSYINIGYIYTNFGNYPEAIKNYYNGLKIAEKIGEHQFMTKAYSAIGYIYMNQQNYPKALKYFFDCIKIQQETGDKFGLGFTYSYISSIYSQKGNNEEAMKYALLTLKLHEEINNKSGIASAYSCIAWVNENYGKYDEAIKNLQSALNIYDEIKDKSGICGVCIDIGNVYRMYHKYKDASIYYNKGISLGKEIGKLEFVKNGYAGLAELDSAQGNYESALQHYKLFIMARDSLFNKANTEKLVAMQMNYDFSKKQEADSIKVSEEKKVIKAELKSEQTKSYALYSGLALMIVVSGIFFKQRNKISFEKKRSDDLLLNILPFEVAEELKNTGVSQTKTYNMVTVMFTDFKGFTKISEQVSGQLLVEEIHYCFSTFDNILQKHNVEKIKTIGDAYMCAGGLPVANETHAVDVVKASIEIRDFMMSRKKEKEARGETPFELRIGVHTGPVVAGIVGIKKFQYDIWGDTVNFASRMESSGEVGKINISENTYEMVKNDFMCEYRGKIAAKNKGEVDMYFVEAKI